MSVPSLDVASRGVMPLTSLGNVGVVTTGIDGELIASAPNSPRCPSNTWKLCEDFMTG